jgi:hypothetical protein
MIQRSGPLVRRRTGFTLPTEAVSHGGQPFFPAWTLLLLLLLLEPALFPIAHGGPIDIS